MILQLDGFIAETDDLALQHLARKLRIGGEMQIGEDDQPGPEESILDLAAAP